jgi:SNF2 family DNA or RNA helicase
MTRRPLQNRHTSLASNTSRQARSALERTSSRVSADLRPDGKRILVRFPWSPGDLELIKEIPGRTWVPKQRCWAIPADLVAARHLRQLFGARLELSSELLAWGRAHVRGEKQQETLAVATDGDLGRVSEEFAHWLAPFQRADAKFHASTFGSINANDPGTGKTAVTIASLIEAGVAGPVLVIGPVTPLHNAWGEELRRWLPATKLRIQTGGAAWPDTLEDGAWYGTSFAAVSRGKVPAGPWGAVIIDEFHMSGLNNRRSSFAEQIGKLNASRRYALSGTPLDGRAEKLFGALHWVDPNTYSSFWTWAQRWIEMEKNALGYWEFGQVRGELEQEFYAHHGLIMTRRLLDDVMPELPAPDHTTLHVEMSSAQRKQYKAFAEDAVLKIEKETLTVDGILAELTRLSQSANAEVTIAEGTVQFTTNSPKLAALHEQLFELGVGRRPGVAAVVASRFAEFARTAHMWLCEKGYRAGLITGAESEDERNRVIQAFQVAAALDVVVLSSSVGGVGITLDRADTLHELDSDWSTSKVTQLARRIRRMSRVHHTRIFHYRSIGTIDDYIDEVVAGKLDRNRVVDELCARVARAYVTRSRDLARVREAGSKDRNSHPSPQEEGD